MSLIPGSGECSFLGSLQLIPTSHHQGVCTVAQVEGFVCEVHWSVVLVGQKTKRNDFFANEP